MNVSKYIIYIVVKDLIKLSKCIKFVNEYKIRRRFWEGSATYLQMEWETVGLNPEDVNTTVEAMLETSLSFERAKGYQLRVERLSADDLEEKEDALEDPSDEENDTLEDSGKEGYLTSESSGDEAESASEALDDLSEGESPELEHPSDGDSSVQERITRKKILPWRTPVTKRTSLR